MEQLDKRALTRGAHHIGLTVPNLERTRDFFVETLGYRQIGEAAEYPAVFLTDGITMITLWRVVDPGYAIAFDRKNVIGLHHLALTVDPDDLRALHQRLSDIDDVSIEFGPEPLAGLPVWHMMCSIPGGIRVEFLASESGVSA
jgi:catechol 2,3-dioxygenase-like lactoylglutathione lyase family enzyme